VSAIADLACRLAGISFEALPDDGVEAARQRLFDALGAYAVGAATAEAELMRRLTERGPAGTPERIRAMVAATRCTEVDDIHAPSCTTVGSVVVPAALLSAEERGATDRELLCAIVAGYEAMIRLSEAVDGALVLYDGVWPTYLAAPFATAAAGARLLELDAERTGNALAIGLSRATGIAARAPGPRSPRWFDTGCAAADGWLAAEAAAVNMQGDLNLLEGGFGRAVRVVFDGSVFAREPERWRILDVDSKPFCTARQGLSATDAFLRILEERPARGIASVEVAVPGQVRAMIDAQHPPLGVPAQLALAVYDRPALWDVLRKRPRDQPAVQGFMATVRVVEDASLTELFPRKWGGRVHVRWQDGSTFELEVLDPIGSAENPLGWEGLLDKQRKIAEACGLDASWIEPAYELCRGFGAQPGASSAAQLLGLLPT